MKIAFYELQTNENRNHVDVFSHKLNQGQQEFRLHANIGRANELNCMFKRLLIIFQGKHAIINLLTRVKLRQLWASF